jgi:hypothetical protein
VITKKGNNEILPNSLQSLVYLTTNVGQKYLKLHTYTIIFQERTFPYLHWKIYVFKFETQNTVGIGCRQSSVVKYDNDIFFRTTYILACLTLISLLVAYPPMGSGMGPMRTLVFETRNSRTQGEMHFVETTNIGAN